jgi:hypothetical protein
MTWRYRLQQFLRALTGTISYSERRFVVETLPAAELRLFEQMARFDQRHCLDVCQTLVRAGHTEPFLLRAALLHDVGKVDDNGQSIPLIYYGMFVMLKRVAPQLYHYAARNGRGLLHPFAIHAAHEQRGAALVEAAAGPPALIAILRDYASGRETPATRALAWADNQN